MDEDKKWEMPVIITNRLSDWMRNGDAECFWYDVGIVEEKMRLVEQKILHRIAKVVLRVRMNDGNARKSDILLLIEL
jgi:hypothetical protein